MPYNENTKKANLKYFKEKQKRVSLNWLKTDFEQYIEPAIRKSGKPVGTFIKEAVYEKLNREHLL